MANLKRLAYVEIHFDPTGAPDKSVVRAVLEDAVGIEQGDVVQVVDLKNLTFSGALGSTPSTGVVQSLPENVPVSVSDRADEHAANFGKLLASRIKSQLGL